MPLFCARDLEESLFERETTKIRDARIRWEARGGTSETILQLKKLIVDSRPRS